MADIQSNIDVNIDTSSALSSIKLLQKQLSAFHTSMAKGSAEASIAASKLQQNLVNNINASGKFTAQVKTIRTTTESFTSALEKNKLSMGEYFRYAGGASKSFGTLFKSEFDTISKVARERVKDLQTQYIKLGRDANGAMKAISVRPLALDMNDLATKTAIAAQKQQLMNQLLKQGSTNLLNFGKNTQWAGRQLMVGFTIPLTILGTTAGKVFMQMEEQAIKFKRVYGDIFTTPEDVNKVLKDIQRLAAEFTKYGVSVADTMEMAATAAATGKVGAELMATVAEATRLSVLGGVEQAQALETTISLTNAFGIAAEDLSKKINFLNAVENQTITSIEDLTIAIPKAGPVVQQLGGDVEDLAFFLTAMKEGGINASEGANALKSGLASMINPTGKATEFLSSFGINLKGIVEANKGDVKGTVVAFASALDTLDPLNRARAIEQLFGKFQFARISTLFKNVVAQGSQANTVLQLAQATTEELAILSERELNRISDSSLYKFKKAIEDIKASLAPVGEAFMKIATPIVEFGRKALDAFNNLDEGTKGFIIGLTAVLGGIGPIAVMTFGLLMNGIAMIVKGFTAVKSLFNKTGSASTVLGEQVSYMTTEQIQAAAVAASLDQVHGKLSQTFSSEARAVDSLTSAYKRSVAAQNAFMGTGTSGRKRKGYANGIVSVPGPKGAGDIVPAMLSPEEAVIPAKPAKKYRGLIKGIIADNIPGFNQGTPGVGNTRVTAYGNATMFLPEQMNKDLDRQRGKEIVPVEEVSSYLKKAGRAAMRPLMSAMAKEMGLSATDPRFLAEWSQIGDKLSSTVVTALETSGKKMVSDADLEEVLVPAIKKATKGVTVANKSLSEAYDKTVKNLYTINKVGSSSKDVTEGGKATGGRAATSRMSYIASRRKAQDLAISDNPDMFRRNVVQSSRGSGSKSRFETFDLKTKSWTQGVMAHITKSAEMTLNEYLVKVKPLLGDITTRATKIITRGLKLSSGQAAEALAKSAVTGFNDTAQKTAKTNSESRRTRKIAKDTVDGYANELERGKKRVVRTGKQTAEVVQKPGIIGRATGAIRGMGPGGIGMAVSGLAMGASMMPGPIGEAAGAITGPLFAASSALSFIPGPAKVVVAALGAVGVAGFMIKQKFDATRDASIKLAESMGNGTKAMESLAKASGKVSAGEVMDKRRKSAFSPFALQPGSTTFGDTFLKSEEGKSVLQTVQKSGQSSSQLFSQLSAAVSTGAMGVQQARSIAESIAKELGNYELAMDVNGKLTSLFGVNGENLLTDALQIRVKLVEESTGSLKASATKLRELNPSRDSGASAIGAGIGMVAGGALGSFAGPGGTVAGAIGGAFIGKMAADSVQTLSNLERVNQESAAFATNAKMALQYNQDQIDALELDYEKRIAIATQSGDQAEVERLINERLTARQKLLDANEKTVKVIQDSFKNADFIKQGFLGQAVDKQISDLYAGTGREALAQSSLNQINSSGGTLEQKYVLKTYLASGDLSTEQMDTLISMFGKDSTTTTAGINFLAKYGTGFTSQALSLVQMFDKPEQQTRFMAYLGTKDASGAKDTLDAFMEIQKSGGVVDVDILLNYYEKNVGKAEEIGQMVKDLKATKGPLTLDVVAKVIGKEDLAALNVDAAVFNNLPKDQQITYLTTLRTVMDMQGDPTMKKLWQTWVATNKPKDASFPAFANYLAGKEVAVQAAAAPKVDPDKGGNTGGGGGEKAVNLLDDIKKGINDAKMSKALSAKNIAPGLVDMLSTATKKTQDLYVVIKKGKFYLTAQGQALQAAFNTKVIKDFVSSQQSLVSSSAMELKARKLLVQAGFDQAKAIELAAKADVKAAYAAAAATKGKAAQAKAIKEVTNAIKLGIAAEESTKTAEDRFTDLFGDIKNKLSADREAISIDFELKVQADQATVAAAEAEIAILQNKINGYQNGLDQIQEQEDDLNKTYDVRYAALDKIERANSAIADRQQQQLDFASALSSGDIAAAAKAAREMRAKQAAEALANQREALDVAKERELANIRNDSGLTRIELENKIKALEKEVKAIEISRLEPANERIRLATVERDIKLTALDAEDLKWRGLQNQIDLAKTKVFDYITALKDANALLLEFNANQNPASAPDAGGVDTSGGVNTGGVNTGAGNAGGSGSGSTGSGSSSSSTSTGLAGGAGNPAIRTPALATVPNKTQLIAAPEKSWSFSAITNPGKVLAPVISTVTKAVSSFVGTAAKTVGSWVGSLFGFSNGGMVPQYFAKGGYAKGTDTVPAMLTPGEFIISRGAAANLGLEKLKGLNSGKGLSEGMPDFTSQTYRINDNSTTVNRTQNTENRTSNLSTVYNNYDLSVNVRSDANPSEIARTVVAQIQKTNDQRLRGNRY